MDKIIYNPLDSHPSLPIPIGSELMVESEKHNLRLKINLVGMEHGQYILAKLPPDEVMGNIPGLKESDIRLSYLHGDAVYGFSSEVLNMVSNPSKLFFFTYPKEIKQINTRASARFRCRLEAMTMLGNELASVEVTDISKDGCQFTIKDSLGTEEAYLLLQVNKNIDLKVQFPGMDRLMPFGGRVRTVMREPGSFNIGVKFDNLNEDAKTELDNFLMLVSLSRNSKSC